MHIWEGRGLAFRVQCLFANPVARTSVTGGKWEGAEQE